MTSGRPKMASEADFGRFCADSGPPFGPMFGTFRHFLGGRNFDRFLIEFRGLIRRGRRQGVGLRKLILSLQTPNLAFVSEGHRKEIPSRFTPRRGAANFTGYRLCRRPLLAFDEWMCGGVGGQMLCFFLQGVDAVSKICGNPCLIRVV